jgi:hypothetical protein
MISNQQNVIYIYIKHNNTERKHKKINFMEEIHKKKKFWTYKCTMHLIKGNGSKKVNRSLHLKICNIANKIARKKISRC